MTTKLSPAVGQARRAFAKADQDLAGASTVLAISRKKRDLGLQARETWVREHGGKAPLWNDERPNTVSSNRIPHSQPNHEANLALEQKVAELQAIRDEAEAELEKALAEPQWTPPVLKPGSWAALKGGLISGYFYVPHEPIDPDAVTAMGAEKMAILERTRRVYQA